MFDSRWMNGIRVSRTLFINEYEAVIYFNMIQSISPDKIIILNSGQDSVIISVLFRSSTITVIWTGRNSTCRSLSGWPRCAKRTVVSSLPSTEDHCPGDLKIKFLECSRFENFWRDFFGNFLEEYTKKPFKAIANSCCRCVSHYLWKYSRHTRLVHGKTLQVQCDVCNRRYENVEKHIEEYHATEAKIPCDTCGKLFLTLEKLRHHRIVHTREKKVCEICHTEVVQMKQHMALVHSSYRKYACTVEGCNTTFFNKLAYRKHMLHVHEGVKYTCELCNKEVVNLKSHIRLVHKKIRSHECPECKKTFQTQPYLRLHIARVHLGVKETCPDCGKQVSNVKSHQLYVHQGMRNFPCDQCETRCHTRRALKDHINSVHLGERVKCPDCGLRFGKNSLPKHRKGCYASHTYAKHQVDEITRYLWLAPRITSKFGLYAIWLPLCTSLPTKHYTNISVVSIHTLKIPFTLLFPTAFLNCEVFPTNINRYKCIFLQWNNIFKCIHCKERFRLKCNLERHLQTKHLVYIFLQGILLSFSKQWTRGGRWTNPNIFISRVVE